MSRWCLGGDTIKTTPSSTHHLHNIINTTPSTLHHQKEHHQHDTIKTTPSTQHHKHIIINTTQHYQHRGLGKSARLNTVDARCVCVAGAALRAPQSHFAWQAQHLEHLSLILRGRCSTWSTSVSFCVAGAARGAPPERSAEVRRRLSTVMGSFKGSCSIIIPFCTSTHHHLHNTIYTPPSTLHRRHNTIYTTSSNTTSSTHTIYTTSSNTTSSTQPHQHITI